MLLRATAALALVLTVTLTVTLTGCSAASSGAAPSPSASVVAGATCPSGEELVRLAGGALGSAAAGETEVGDVLCDGEWAAAQVLVDEGLPGRVALRWDGQAWAPAFVGGAEGACPATLRSAPAGIRQVMGC